MGNCHEADTNLTEPRDKKNPHINPAFKSLDAAREFAKQFPGAYIRESNLLYETSNKFYAGDDPL